MHLNIKRGCLKYLVIMAISTFAGINDISKNILQEFFKDNNILLMNTLWKLPLFNYKVTPLNFSVSH